jgi:signal transduction histidine kinase
MKEDICQNRILVTEGKEACTQILNEILEGTVEAKFLDLLFCEGCINGPGFPNDLSVFARKEQVASYVQSRLKAEKEGRHKADMRKYSRVLLQRTFSLDDRRLTTPSPDIIREILRRTNKVHPEDELNCGPAATPPVRKKPAPCTGAGGKRDVPSYLIDQLEENLSRLAQSHKDLGEAQQQLIQSEKMASVGQLAAGVAHEINNPLGPFSSIPMILEKLEAKDSRREELDTIAKEATRCRDIVRGLLDFARQRSSRWRM